MCGIRLTVPPLYSKLLSKFPQKFSFCFAYGSGVKLQLQNVKPNMIDFVYCVENANKWHEENLKINSSHYSFLKFFGHNVVSKFQENAGAKVYFNTLVNIDDVTIKYGVISRKDLVTDLLEWSDLYLAGRLHKPVEIVRKTTNAELQTALQLNLQSAVHAALLLLPESFTEYDFYHTICNLSYSGDFRMIFGENKNKVSNIVKPQLSAFRNLYKPLIKSLHDYVEFPVSCLEIYTENQVQSPKELLNLDHDLSCKQDVSPLAKLHHLNQLPRWPQKAITRFWNRGTVAQDTEDVLRAIAYDPDCGAIVEQCINQIVWQSSIRQSLKGIITAVNMPYPLSDEESSDSDNGVRFKTTNTRDKFKTLPNTYNAKIHKNEYKSVNKFQEQYNLVRTKQIESKSTNISKYHTGKSKCRRENKYYRSKTPEKYYSSNDTRKSDSHIHNKRKRHDSESKAKSINYESVSTRCTEEKEKNIRKFSVHQATCSQSKQKNSETELPRKQEVSKISDINTCAKNYFGPSLPPKYSSTSKKNDPQLPQSSNESHISKLNICDTIQESKICDNLSVYGPRIPLHFKDTIPEKNEPTVTTYLNDDPEEMNYELIGPTLDHLKNVEVVGVPNKRSDVIGPTLPEHLKANIKKEYKIQTANHMKNNESDIENNIIGPLPAQYSNPELEERALQIKLDLLNKTAKESSSREEWMLELPAVHCVTQSLGPRKFRTKEMPDLSDRSVWTDTANDKTNKNSTKVDLKLEAKLRNLKQKDSIQEKIVDNEKKKVRCKSLIDIHCEELKKKKMKDKSIANERRPFSRDIDLKTNRFNDAQTKAIIKKANLLDSRFSSGQSKFL